MKAMIFAAGLGTRFKPWTDSHPKALAIINSKSLLQRNIEYLQSYGISDVVVNVHHYAEQIIDAVEKNSGWGSHVVISDESTQLLETGGGLYHARHLLMSNEPFLTLNADILTNLPIDKLLSFHQENQSFISLGISDRASSRNFLFNQENRLCGWENTITQEQKMVIPDKPLHPMAYSCVALFQPTIFEYIEQRGAFSLTETYLSLAPQHKIMGYTHEGTKFIDVGKTESISIAEKMFL